MWHCFAEAGAAVVRRLASASPTIANGSDFALARRKGLCGFVLILVLLVLEPPGGRNLHATVWT